MNQKRFILGIGNLQLSQIRPHGLVNGGGCDDLSTLPGNWLHKIRSVLFHDSITLYEKSIDDIKNILGTELSRRPGLSCITKEYVQSGDNNHIQWDVTNNCDECIMARFNVFIDGRPQIPGIAEMHLEPQTLTSYRYPITDYGQYDLKFISVRPC